MDTGITRRDAVRAGLLTAGSPLWLAGAAAAVKDASAETYPIRAPHLVVPFTPGGSTDVLARSIGQELGRAWNQPVVIDNVPGAGGALGAERVAKAPADGYMLLMAHIGTLAINPSLYPRLAYHPQRSFAPVAWVARVPNVLVVNASVPARTLGELVALAKARPGQLAYGSGGNGSAAHIAMEYLKLQTGTSLLHVPYRGTGPAVNDLLAGQLQACFTGTPALLPHLQSGRLRALAVSSPRRIALLPEVPTVAESGVAGTPGFEADQWYGVVAPAGTPRAIVAMLNAQINRSLASEEVKTRLAAEGAEPTPATPAVFGELIASEMVRWARVIKAARITID
jgi:tripartite-type tricarboxylate transporter receptor subunit TctC